MQWIEEAELLCATDSKDKVYALLGMAYDVLDGSIYISPDYSPDSSVELVKETVVRQYALFETRKMLQKVDSLEISTFHRAANHISNLYKIETTSSRIKSSSMPLTPTKQKAVIVSLTNLEALGLSEWILLVGKACT
jgi:hypothetical protein